LDQEKKRSPKDFEKPQDDEQCRAGSKGYGKIV
jgi:hypothetical protein